jgi:hypothetical protein
MSFDAKRLYELLPAVYRTRAADQGEPLKQFLGVIATQIALLEEDIDQLYDDQFIETCAEWVIPYIGELIGYRKLYGRTSQVRSPRAEVADTIGLRRSKGTAAMLGQLARDVTGWDACAVEMFQLLATTQFMNHLRPGNLGTPDLRDIIPLERVNGPFDRTAHTIDVRRIANGRGRYNIGNVAIYLWRLRSYSLKGSPAFRLDNNRYLFNPLGAPTRLFRWPVSGISSDSAEPQSEVQMPMTRLMVHAGKRNPGGTETSYARFYGSDKSFFIDGVTADQISICDLSDAAAGAWAHAAAAGKVSVDPVLGRIAFGTPPVTPPSVTFHYGFSDDLGGGEYERLDSIDLTLQPVVKAPAQGAGLQGALTTAGSGGAVEIGDNGHYAATPAITVTAANKSIELRAANTTRPLLALGGDLVISGEDGSEVTLNGLLISGGPVRVKETAGHKKLRLLRLRHCTLVPGTDLLASGAPRLPDAPSIIVETADTIVEIDHCIIGGMRVAPGAQVTITNSIVDATRESGVAFAAIDGVAGGGALHVENSTIIGKVHTSSLTLASNSVFLAQLAQGDGWQAPVWSDRRQEGCLRFSYLPLASRVPRRYRCQPAAEADMTRVRPNFTSLTYGDPGYCQISHSSALEIREGAEDGAEIGVFHGLFQSQRETNLRVRLKEYARFDLDVGFIFVT